jgi:hypothetical protein
MQWESLAAWIEARGHGQGDGYPGENMLACNALDGKFTRPPTVMAGVFL